MESIPDDIQKHILIRLPLKSLLACIFVCKKWKTMIYDEDFKSRYLLRSMTRPMDPTPHSLFHTVYEDSLEEWTSSEPVRGVVCLQSSDRFLLCNPITNNVLRLPDIEELRLFSQNFILGYDEDNGVFKVLWPRLYDKPLVYTVRSDGEGSGRPIACEHPHTYLTPFRYINEDYDPPQLVTNALCKGGVLYYAAIDQSRTTITIMSFDLSSEEFTVNPLPEGVILYYDVTMVNYNGNVAVVNNKSETGEFEICIRNEVSGQWELQRLVIPGWRDNVGNDMLFSFVGTIGTGELVFTAPSLVNDGSESVLYYKTDPPQGSKMYRIEADNGGSYHYIRACFNHFDCLLRAN